ncbi:hypothetical protein [Halalkalicoccus jeotgali]|nr:hypothetical protein [Halalkalicoccus jeotgali]
MIAPQVTATGELTSETTVVSKSLEDYDTMIVPSGIETALSVEKHPVVSWLWSATNYRYKVSV